MTTTIGQLGAELGLEIRGESSTALTGVATLSNAGNGQLTFLANPKYSQHLSTTTAAAVILHQDMAENCPVTALLSPDPYADYARAASRFDYSRQFKAGIHPTATIAADVRLGNGVCVGPQAVIDTACEIGDNCHIGAGTVLGPGCKVGNDSFLAARVTLCREVVLGQRVIIHPGAVIGADGFGIAMTAESWIKVPQLGGVQIGDDCEIGANTTIDRGALEDTLLENDVRLDNLVQIAHNVQIGAHTAMAGCAAAAGSARIGRYCLIGGGAGILGHLEVADHVTLTARTLVTHSIKQAGEYSSGTPLQEKREWRKNTVRLRQLDALARRVSRLEKESKS
jgi:UDP-3-O-[3-hydroxymyristoyl] glucosamine N-acyltransferase